MDGEALEREARRRGRVVYVESQRGGAGYYRWWVALDGAAPHSGLADTEAEGWEYVKAYVNAQTGAARRVRRTRRGDLRLSPDDR